MLKGLDSNARRLSTLEKQLQAIDTVADDAEQRIKRFGLQWNLLHSTSKHYRLTEACVQCLEKEVQGFTSADEFKLAESPRLLQNDNGHLCLCRNVAKNKEDNVEESASSAVNQTETS